MILDAIHPHCRQQVEESRLEAKKDKVDVPETVEAYCIKHNPEKSDEDVLSIVDEDYYGQSSDESEEEPEEDEEEDDGNDEDSGQGEN